MEAASRLSNRQITFPSTYFQTECTLLRYSVVCLFFHRFCFVSLCCTLRYSESFVSAKRNHSSSNKDSSPMGEWCSNPMPPFYGDKNDDDDGNDDDDNISSWCHLSQLNNMTGTELITFPGINFTRWDECCYYPHFTRWGNWAKQKSK